MSVDHTHGLQERINDGRADERHPTLFQVFGDGVGQRRGRPHGEVFLHDFVPGKGPDIVAERAEFLLDFLEYDAVIHGCLDL